MELETFETEHIGEFSISVQGNRCDVMKQATEALQNEEFSKLCTSKLLKKKNLRQLNLVHLGMKNSQLTEILPILNDSFCNTLNLGYNALTDLCLREMVTLLNNNTDITHLIVTGNTELSESAVVGIYLRIVHYLRFCWCNNPRKKVVPMKSTCQHAAIWGLSLQAPQYRPPIPQY